MVDLHAITVAHDPAQLRQDILGVTATLLGCGLDPQRTTLFQQSSVREHSELAWLLSCRTPLGWLNRMTQFKDKSQKSGQDKSHLGLYSYPVLMAADILLYRATHVPVGDDQRQHLELARDIATSFNNEFLNPSSSTSSSSSSSSSSSAFVPFPLPESVLVDGNSARVMSLKDGTNKMSKSDKSALSRINLTDSVDEIVKKIKKSKTDSITNVSYVETLVGGGEGGGDGVPRPEVKNLIGILSAIKQIEEPAREWDDMKVCQALDDRNATTKDLKDELTEVLVQHVCPIGENIRALERDPVHLSTVLKKGGDKAREIAEDTMKDVRASMGLA